MSIRKTLIVLFVVLLSISCNDDKIYDNLKTFKGYQWQRLSDDQKNANKIEFTDIEVKDIDTPYDIYVGLRHSSVINTDQIKFMIEVISPNGTRRSSIHTIKLKDRDGTKFIGDVMGDFYDVEGRIKSFMSFTETGKHIIRITNLSQSFVIVGIIDLSIRIVKSDIDYSL